MLCFRNTSKQHLKLMSTIENLKLMDLEIKEAAHILNNAGLVAFPTETVYGLGADANNPIAVKKIFLVKGRPVNHPVIVHIFSVQDLDKWARAIPKSAIKLAKTFWPGPLTLILKKQSWVLDEVTGKQDTVGLRIPNHPVALALLKTFSSGIAAPSANQFGYVSPTAAEHVKSELGAAVDMVLNGGECQVGLESTILDLSSPEPRLLRPGSISLQELEDCIGQKIIQEKHEQRVSGTLKSHYKPKTPTYLVDKAPLDIRGIAVLSYRVPPVSIENIIWKRLPDDPKGYAQKLYAVLRELDNAGVTSIFIEKVPSTPIWWAIRDRLQRATA